MRGVKFLFFFTLLSRESRPHGQQVNLQIYSDSHLVSELFRDQSIALLVCHAGRQWCFERKRIARVAPSVHGETFVSVLYLQGWHSAGAKVTQMAAMALDSVVATESEILPDCPCFVADISRKRYLKDQICTQKRYFARSQELKWEAFLTNTSLFKVSCHIGCERTENLIYTYIYSYWLQLSLGNCKTGSNWAATSKDWLRP